MSIDAELDAMLGDDFGDLKRSEQYNAYTQAIHVRQVDELPSADVIKPQAFNPPAHPQWDRCKAWIEASLEADMLTLADVEKQIRDGKAQMWPGKACVIVTEIVTYPKGDKVFQTLVAGGDMAEIEQMIPGVEAYGRNEGCTMARIEGRRGWERRMKAFGYSFASSILTKAL